MGLAIFGPTPADRLQGFKAKGRATLVGNPGTVVVTPGPAVVATDEIMILGSTPAGTPGGKFVQAITAGAAGVGTFELRSTGNDQSIVTWGHFDNTFLG